MIIPLTPQNAYLLENQKLYSDAQKWLAINHPHLMYVVPRRISFSKAARRAVFEREEGVCYHCGCELNFDDFHIDHLEPIARGGSNDPSNLAASCPPCNLKKGAN